MVKAALTLITGLLAVAQAFNNPPGVKVWCGKAYMASNASFNPGGQLAAPKPAASPMLDLKVRPRMNLYTADDTAGSFIVDAALSYIHGKPYTSSPSDGGHPSANSTGKDSLIFDISLVNGGQTLVHGKSVPVNSTGHEFNFSLAGLAPRKQPYQVQLIARDARAGGGTQTYKATAEVLHLPARTDGGSATKIDSLHGGLLVQDWTRNSTAWEPLYPYSYYASWSGYFQNNASAPGTFRSLGYNIVHIVPDGSVPLGFDESQFDAFLNECDRVGLRVMYDMRWSYLNISAVTAQVARYSKHPSVLLWYTADEPDGATDPLNGTLLAYRAVKAVDPYRPVSLVLNCANFYYEEYTRGADIVLEDAYPVGINATYSVEWHTPCNDTYGDCGCDDCHGSLRDISDRLDSLAAYQTWIGGGATSKPLWGVPQAFDGSDEYWAGAPDAAQEVAMDLLSINHGAKGLVAWTWPTEPDLASVTSRLAKVLTAPQITGYLLGATLVPLTGVSGATNAGALDVASWRLGKSMLVSAAYLQTASVSGPVRIALPQGSKAKAIASTPWASSGSSSWAVDGSGNLVKSGLQRLETALLVVDLA